MSHRHGGTPTGETPRRGWKIRLWRSLCLVEIPSKRSFIVGRWSLGRSLGRRSGRFRVFLGFAPATGEHLHALPYNFCGVASLAILVPGTGLDTPLNKHQRALLQILTDDFREFSEENYAVPFRFLLLFAVLLPAFAGGDIHASYGFAIVCITDLGICAEKSDQLNLVKHDELLKEDVHAMSQTGA